MNFAGCLTGFFEDMYLDFLIFFFYFSDTFCFLFERQGRQREREWMSG